MITLQTTIHDGRVSLLGNAFLPNLGIKPVGITPHVMVNLAELDSSRRVVLDSVPEGGVEFLVVEEDVGVVIPSVEVAFNRLDGLDHAIQLLVSREDDKDTVGTRFASVGLAAADLENLVILFADFSVNRQSRALVDAVMRRIWRELNTNLTAGGAPAGINILPGEVGCLTNNVKMRTTTMQGKRMTTPSGTEMLELPFSLRGRLRYARREASVPRCLFSSAVGR